MAWVGMDERALACLDLKTIHLLRICIIRLQYTEYIQGSLDWIDDIYEIWGPLWEGMGVGGNGG